MAYPPTTVYNYTNYAANGEATYIACSHWDYNVNGWGQEQHSRGLCLMNKLTATVVVNNENVEASPYTSSGTSYSQFAIIQTDAQATSFAVTRLVTSQPGDQVPAEDVEPPTDQD